MKLLLSLITVLSLSFCQSQTVQTIGNKEVIVMSVEDGKRVNESFEKKQKEIDSLKSVVDSTNKNFKLYMIHSGARLQSMYNSYNEEKYKNDGLRIERDSAVFKYMANKKIYEKREKDFRSERIAQQFFTAAVIVITFILAAAN